MTLVRSVGSAVGVVVAVMMSLLSIITPGRQGDPTAPGQYWKAEKESLLSGPIQLRSDVIVLVCRDFFSDRKPGAYNMIDVESFLPKQVVLSILCGLILNIAVALSCATWSNFSSSDQEVVQDAVAWPRDVGSGWPRENILITTEKAFGLTLIKSGAMVKRRKDPTGILENYLNLIGGNTSDKWIEEATELLQDMQSEGDAEIEEQVITVIDFIRKASKHLDETVRTEINQLLIQLTDRSLNYSQYVREAGWPFRALDAEARSDQSLEPRSRYAIDLGMIRGGLQTKRGLWLPLHPMWPGFLLNTLLYMLILWPLSMLPSLCTRISRRKANKCPSCGTAIGVDSVCEQCGQDLSEFWGN